MQRQIAYITPGQAGYTPVLPVGQAPLPIQVLQPQVFQPQALPIRVMAPMVRQPMVVQPQAQMIPQAMTYGIDPSTGGLVMVPTGPSPVQAQATPQASTWERDILVFLAGVAAALVVIKLLGGEVSGD